jgi:DNA-binding PadR family transcriptional regulator
MTGYDLKTFFNRSINFFWSAELSQIYRELSKLERNSYISYEIIPQEGKPDKKVYSITEGGKIKFIEWLRDFPHDLTPISRNEFLVRIFFSAKIPKEELILNLSRYIKQEEQELKTYMSIEDMINARMKEQKDDEELMHQRLTVRRGLYFAQSEINWAKECIEEIQKRQFEE